MSVPEVQVRSARHVKAARARWGVQRVVKLSELDADTARLIRALLANRDEPAGLAVRTTNEKAAGEAAPTADAEGQGHDRPAA